jgi:P pilus assembly chaperone PapD
MNIFFKHPSNRRSHWLAKSVAGLTMIASIASTPVNANGFLLAPTRVFFESSSRSQEVTIMNQSDKTQTYRLRLEDRRLKENGEYEVITAPGDPSAASQMLRLSVRQIVVPARTSATVRVLLRKPSGLSAGEVRSHLIVTELPVVNPPVAASETATDITISITTVFGISIPIMVRTGETTARITTVTPRRVAVPDRPDLENLDIQVQVAGNRSLFVDLRLISTRQRRGEPIALAKSFAIYAPLQSRTLTMSLSPEQTAKLRAGNVVLQYQEVNRDGAPIGAPSEVAF